jgi:hypothetical protein
VDLPLFLYPRYHSFGYSLSHRYSYIRWPTQRIVSPPTMLRTMERTTTKMPTRRHPLRLLLSKCWLCKHMFQTMQQTMVNMHAQLQAPPPLRDGLGDFQRTKLPIFSYAVELMDANDWLKSVEKKLQVVQCNNREKVLLASHQLFGPAPN